MATSPEATLTWAQTAALNPHAPICLCCGAELAPALVRPTSLRCRDCRQTRAQLDPDGVRECSIALASAA